MERFACLTAVALLCSAQAAPACCGKRMHRKAHQVACAQPAMGARPMAYPRPASAPPMATGQQAMAMPAQADPAVASAGPSYNYQPAMENRAAYYYSYDASGKLIVTQWVDWLFRGGRDAGVPRPPLPVIGLLRN